MRHGGLRERRQISPLLRTLAPTPKSENRPDRLPEEDKGDALRSLPIESDFPVDATTRERNGESRRRKPLRIAHSGRAHKQRHRHCAGVHEIESCCCHSVIFCQTILVFSGQDRFESFLVAEFVCSIDSRNVSIHGTKATANTFNHLPPRLAQPDVREFFIETRWNDSLLSSYWLFACPITPQAMRAPESPAG